MPIHGAPRHDHEPARNYDREIHNPGDNVVVLDDRRIDCGPRCRTCRTTEAQCAWRTGCCDRCSHFGPRLKLLIPTCGSEQAYQRHRYRKEPTCQPCRDAHTRHNVARSS